MEGRARAWEELVELRLLLGEAKILPPHALEGDGLRKPRFDIGPVPLHGHGEHVPSKLVHGPVPGEDGPGGHPQPLGHLSGRDGVDPLLPHRLQGGGYDLLPLKLYLWGHGLSSPKARIAIAAHRLLRNNCYYTFPVMFCQEKYDTSALVPEDGRQAIIYEIAR